MTVVEREYLAVVGNMGDRIRVRFATERGRVFHYTVQFEVLDEGRHWPAVRYDSAHGVPHRDTLDWLGETIDKTWFPDSSLANGLTFTQQQIRAGWFDLREAFLRRKP